MKAMKLNWLLAVIASGLMGFTASAASVPSPWEQPAAAIAAQIAEILGPAQARLTMRNITSIPASEIPTIRLLIEQDLKTHGVVVSGAESANEIRITLSENQRERLWVAEVIEGNETRVAMVQLDLIAANPAREPERIVLHKDVYVSGTGFSRLPGDDEPVLATVDTGTGLVVLKENQIVLSNRPQAKWMASKVFNFNQRQQSSRDPRGIILAASDGNGFTSFTAGNKCIGFFTPSENSSARPGDGWSIDCKASDDPWPIVQSDTGNGSLKAFYNASRNYFTGVVSPSLGVDLPPFYTAALLPRPAENQVLLIGGIDGKVQLLENGALKQVSGARDWGSDFAVLHSGCGAGTQIIASGSGEAVSDSLRAYELPALEAVPVSAALAVDGTVTALWSAPDGKSVFAVVRGATDQYEVDRVTATCNE
jgi:hypothetical protein